ncbi:sulfur oxidation c-type cytochrome SoxA [Cohaesibacter sp. CAU 1516]|uniref:sulfur oxidation c-type cytochrome SoxA n=1 Tax=Cohaesibacter sp. CAU 1516 TaxID=2576038 RepID=UPI0010FE313C|nr:sulfur oxidation c-type cytochrome SoxA [Cohaesibacter sp. CAU 1516]TLP46870.1 sulfur oxidation c-type cytochrome SoxA [Cohaesibacter sp. CAU 1516]
MAKGPIILSLALGVGITMTSMSAMAGEDSKLVIDGQEFVTKTEAPDHLKDNLDEIYSGWVFRSDETQALQLDDFDNPAFVFIDQATEQFDVKEGSANKACADCHSGVEDFKGLRAMIPRVKDGKLQTMEDQINQCRTEQMGAEPWKWGGATMQSMVALIGLQSRGMPMNVKIDGDAKPFWEKGKEIYYTRHGQLDMACANCHEDNYGNNIRADHLSQGQLNGFPTYRLKNAKLNSVHDRLFGCIRDVRAEPYKVGSDAFRALELYVSSRGNGLTIETPAVRN